MKRVTQTAAVLLWALLLAFGAAGTARAQAVTTSALAGRITNEQGAGIPGVTVLVVNTSNGTQNRGVSQSDGRWSVQGLQPGGPYRVTVSGLGYTTQTRENIQLALGTTKELNLQLAAQAVALAGITATAERAGAVISSAHTGTAHVISDSAITRLPTLSRDFTDFTRLVPQASTSGAGTNGGGRNNRFNSIQIDGAVNNDLFGLAASGTPGGQAGTKPITLEAIQQFQVVLAPFDVRQGGFTGMGVNAVTKSGTNRVNGTLTFFGRNQDLTGRYRFIEADTNAIAPRVAEFKEYQTAFSLGGPIVRNRAFFFVAGEMARRNAPTGRFIGGPGITLNPTKVDSVINILTNQYGFSPGGVADVNLRRQSNNLFGRLDFNLGRGNRLTLRHNFVDAWDDNFATRTDAFYQFTEAGYRFNSKTHASVGQLNSTLFGRFFNELRAGYTTVRENRGVPVSPFPRVEVLLPGACGGSTCLVTGGPENSSVANALNQDILEITDDVNFALGAHNLTIGTHNEFFKFSNLFAQNIYGLYRFTNIDSLIAGRPQRYDYTFFNETTPGASRRAEFPVRSYALYAQDKVSIGNLSLTGGVRLDMTMLPKNPGDNTLFATRMDSAFSANGFDWGGRRTSQIPDHMMTINPRLGFNWDATGDGSTQLRGGVGLFAGRTPYVWISNAYGNTGLDYTSFSCTTAATAPNFVADPFNQPQGCRTSSGGITLPSLAPNNINTVDPDFQMPQVLRTSLALDRELPLGLVGTLEGLFTQSLNDVTYRDLTVVGFRQRAVGGDSIVEGRRVIRRITAPGFGNVYDVTNTSRNYSYSLTAQLQREFRGGWGGSFAYTYGKAFDVNAVRSSTARSQFRFNPVPEDPNFIPLAYSDYDVRHRIVADFSRQFMFIRRAPLDFSLIYVGESGRPYSYTYFGDVNGDSQDSNDLIYVPRAQGEVRFASTGTISPAQSWANLNDFIERVDCLRENRGRIIPRNACRQPWSNRFDVRVAQTLPTVRNQGLQLTVDILNVANLLNPEWGRSQFVNNQAETLLSRSGTTDTGGHVLLNAFAPKPNVFQTSDLSSRYQVQIGLKYDF
ncbi:MAG TPA: carboxypeptidase-like regulatory domain-containing protein [Longimicrobium sp.]